MRPLVAGASDVDTGGRCRVPGAHVALDAVPHVREADEVGVRVEDHDTERRLGKQPLEDRAERVGLPRARLAAQERVAVERSRVESERHALGEGERAHVEHRPGRSHGVQPARDLGRGRHASRSRVEGPVGPLEEPALDAHRRGGEAGPALERHARHVPEAVAADEDVVPDARVEPIRRDVVGEVPSVDRGRSRHDGILGQHARSLSTSRAGTRCRARSAVRVAAGCDTSRVASTLGNTVEVPPLDPHRLEPIIGHERVAELLARAVDFQAVLGARRIVNVNSTARGGGVAEMLGTLLGYTRGVGIPADWVVITGDPEFFAITKRIHNGLYGSARRRR